MITSLLPEWLGLAATPLAIVGTVVLLSTSRPLANSLAFCASFGTVYAVISVVAIAIGSAAGPDAADSATRHVVSLVVGLLFLCIALALTLRPVLRRNDPPRWSKVLASATPGKIFVTGVAASLVNPNVAILFSGLTIVVTVGLPTSDQVFWAFTLVLASLVPFLVPIGIFVTFGERSRRVLHNTMEWMVTHDRPLTIWTLVVFGVVFAWRGLAGLI